MPWKLSNYTFSVRTPQGPQNTKVVPVPVEAQDADDEEEEGEAEDEEKPSKNGKKNGDKKGAAG